MNEQEREELSRFKAQQARLEQELLLLASQLRLFEERLEQQTQAETSPVPPTLAAAIGELPLVTIPPSKPIPPASAPPPTRVVPPPLPPIIQPGPQLTVTASAVQPIPPSAPAETFAASPLPQAAQTNLPPAPPMPPIEPSGEAPMLEPKPSFELRLGTYWAPRVGIVILLTGLVFFGNLAYQNLISPLGPPGKAGLLYFVSTLLMGAGWWWQRKAVKESLKNYAQVLFAGGLAVLYFTTYAAHHIAALKIIDSPLVDGVLLLGCAGFMIWVADYKKSEVMALFAVGLAYYSSIITHVGSFTLYSNLVLTMSAVFFLVRNRWATLSFGSLVATYAAYAFWRFFKGNEWHWAYASEGLWEGTYFLISYWVVFTAAVFLARGEKFVKEARASFLTLNNGAFFSLFLLTMLQVRQGGFWKFSLIYGSVLLAMAVLAQRVLKSDALPKNAYLTQGLLLVTLGFISHPNLAGLQLALVLGTESVLLLVLGNQQKNLVLLTAAYIAAGLSVGWGMDGMLRPEPHGMWLGIALGALMLVNTIVAHLNKPRAINGPLRAHVAYFTILLLVIWWVATWDNTLRERFPLVLLLEGVLLASSIYLLKIPEVTLFSHGYVLMAQALWTYDVFFTEFLPPWWNLAWMMGLTIGFCHWWQKQKAIEPVPGTGEAWRLILNLPGYAKAVLFVAAAQVGVRHAGGWELSSPIYFSTAGLWFPLILGAGMLLDAYMAHRRTAWSPDLPLRWQPTFSTMLTLIVWLAATWHHVPREYLPVVLASEGLLLTLSYYVLRAPEITLLSQLYPVIAQLVWIAEVANGGPLPRWWSPVLLLAITLALSHWWQKQKSLVLTVRMGLAWQGLYSLAIVGVLYFWLQGKFGPPGWLAITAVLAVAFTVYGVVTRAWFIALCGQIFLFISGAQFVWQLAQNKPSWSFPLATISALVILSGGTAQWFRARTGSGETIRDPILQLARVYRWAALAMALWWIWEYIPARERIWVVELVGVAIFAAGGWFRSRETLLFSAAFTLTALAIFWLPSENGNLVYAPNLLTLLALLAQQRVAKHAPERYPLEARIHGTVILLGGLSLWRFVTLWVLENASGFYLTASWSGLALILFTLGIAFRERLYRWLGLGLLGGALARVFIIDVWKIEAPIFRILSFMALGVVLLVLGFVYSKYQEKIKEWL